MNEGTLTPGDAALAQLRRLEAITDIALAHAQLDTMLPELLDCACRTCSASTPSRCFCSTRRRKSSWPARPAASRRRSSAACGSRSAAASQGGSRRERRPIIVPDLDQFEVVNPILREKGIRSMLGVPLQVDGRVVGIMHVGSLTPREFIDEETHLLEQAASRVAPAIEHARLYDAERAARRTRRGRARASCARCRPSPTRRSPTWSSTTCCSRCSTGYAPRSAPTPRRSCCSTRRATSSWPARRAASRRRSSAACGSRSAAASPGRIAAERRVVEIPDLDTADIYNPILREQGIKSMLGAPLLAGGEVRGVVHVGALTPARVHARRGPAAPARRRPDRDGARPFAADPRARRRPHACSRACCPTACPRYRALRVAARYQPGPGGMLGGDWYDAIPLPARRRRAGHRRRGQPRHPGGERDGPAPARPANAARSMAPGRASSSSTWPRQCATSTGARW